eukprot:1022542-Ditylum_brightwellii.AAC.1
MLIVMGGINGGVAVSGARIIYVEKSSLTAKHLSAFVSASASSSSSLFACAFNVSVRNFIFGRKMLEIVLPPGSNKRGVDTAEDDVPMNSGKTEWLVIDKILSSSCDLLMVIDQTDTMTIRRVYD